MSDELSDLLHAVYDASTVASLLKSLCVCAPGSTLSVPEQGGAPLSLVFMARVGFRVVGAAAVRFHHFADGHRAAEILFIAVPLVSRGNGTGESLLAYVRLLTALSDMRLLLWQHPDGDDELPSVRSGEWVPGGQDGAMASAMLRPPIASDDDGMSLCELLAHRPGTGRLGV